ncbi:MAG TPA: ATP-binding cassette domain-containing protein [Micromonosporaceae bacterium]
MSDPATNVSHAGGDGAVTNSANRATTATGAGASAGLTVGSDQALLSCAAVQKYYGAVHALRGVDFQVRPGEFVALVGDNGAGKSTLVKIIAGAIQPSAGTIRMGGAVTRFPTPTAARGQGIETVYQDLGLCDNLSVVENLFLGRELTRGFGPFRTIRRKEMLRVSRDVLGRLSMNVPSPRAKVTALSGGQRQAVALARARLWNQRLVLLDEPTAALGVEETRNCVSTIQEIHAAGAAVVLISHDIPLVRQLSERVVVLRRGQKVGDIGTDQVTEHDIVAMITGAARLGDVPPDDAAAQPQG